MSLHGVIVKTALMTASFMLVATAAMAAPQIEMVQVPGGCYQMGEAFGDGRGDEKPTHETCVSAFRIGKYEVTQAQWVAVMGNNPSNFKGDKLPVENVSWDETQEFINKLNAQTKLRYRLPTEAEWEFAARSGGKNEKWAGINDLNQLRDYAWYSDNSNEKTNIVGTKKPNGLGIYDMSGNVWEWVQDKYSNDWYGKSGRDNPQGPTTGSKRVARGGSWSCAVRNLRSTDRDSGAPDSRDTNRGFRLALPAVK